MVHTSDSDRCFENLDPLLKRTSELLCKIKNEGVLTNLHHSVHQPHRVDHNFAHFTTVDQNSVNGDSKKLKNINSVEKACFHKYENEFSLSENQNLPTTVKIFASATPLNSEESSVGIKENLRDYQSNTKKLIVELKQSNDQIRNLEKSLLAKQSSINELSIELERKTALINSLTIESSTKDILLRQLDSTLGRLTRGWKDNEAKQDLAIKLAKESENRKNKEIEELKNQYQSVRAQWDEELNSIKAEHRLEKISLEEQLSQMNSKCKELEGYNTDSYRTIEELKCKIKNYEQNLQEYQTKLIEQQNGSNLIIKKCAKLKEHWQNQLKHYKDSMRKTLETKKDEIYKLKEEISKVAKKYELEFQDYQKQIDLAAEQRIREQLLAYEQKIQENATQAEETLRNKLREASDRYRQDLDQLRLNAETELSRQMSETEHRIEVERKRVQTAEKQCEHWRIRTREAEEARSALALQINELLQARCTEAMQMLRSSSTTTLLNIPTTHGFLGNNIGSNILTDFDPSDNNLNKESAKDSNESEVEQEQDLSISTMHTFETQILSHIDLNGQDDMGNANILDNQQI
ncbi:unnamed protein product [Schistosoma rodhaini]|uniref:Golgin-84 n=1 Tax=Schistosoma rodhaini TaxID=6188 RepID=A0AA85G2Y2_9TREM|nr:unnamed protein product [Schistosoma rodhaini]